MTFYYAGRCERTRRRARPKHEPYCRLECEDLEGGANGYACRRGLLRIVGKEGAD